jgi:hypothetical protein
MVGFADTPGTDGDDQDTARIRRQPRRIARHRSGSGQPQPTPDRDRPAQSGSRHERGTREVQPDIGTGSASTRRFQEAPGRSRCGGEGDRVPAEKAATSTDGARCTIRAAGAGCGRGWRSGYADHVSVTTPGLGTNVRESLGSMVNEAEQLQNEAGRQLEAAGKPGETVSTIAWIGYDPPQKTYNDLDIATSLPRRVRRRVRRPWPSSTRASMSRAPKTIRTSRLWGTPTGR